MVRTYLACATAVGLTFAFPAGAGATGTSDPNCGGTIMHSLTLHHDLLDCPGLGMSIGADNITLDLNGHTISGTPESSSAGIQVTSHQRATIYGGTIREFQNGIDVHDSSEIMIQQLQLLDNSRFGAVIVGGTANSLVTSRIEQTSDVGAGGVLLFQTTGNRVVRNTLYRNSDGISIVQSSRNLISMNTSSRSGTGIGLFDHATKNLVSLNVTDENTDTGVLLDQHADDNRIIGNFARRNAFAGIALGASDHNDVRLNIASANLGSGIAIVDAAAYTTVSGNIANSNGYTPPGCVPDCPLLDDGIHVDAILTHLSTNVADGNADLGIDAVPAVLGGKDNRARLNVDPRQCAGISCR